MNICVIGTGYVGLVTGALLADRGNKVTCVDNNPAIIESLNAGKLHIFEPGLPEIALRCKARGDLSFSSNLQESVKDSDIIFLAVGTPSHNHGSFNLEFLTAAAKHLATALQSASGFKIVVVKSTVPQGTYKLISSILHEQLQHNTSLQWAYVSNPETLAEGTAVENFSKPDRIIIGTDSNQAFSIMHQLYYPFTIKRERILRCSPADAELAKLFSNTTLATRIAIVNEFARIADNTAGADMDVIRRIICEDSRIGYSFMFPSPGYGGSCFPKDIQGLVEQSKKDGYCPRILDQIHLSNEEHKQYLATRIENILSSIAEPKIAIWGLTFKPNTDDMRDSASIPIITALLNRKARVTAYDPKDYKARPLFGSAVTFAQDKYEAVEDADALILLTEWKEFDSPDFAKLAQLMRGKALFDLRNRWLPDIANAHGFDYVGVGRNYPRSE